MAGSKRKLLPILRQAAPAKFERYVEPFCGSACLFLDMAPDVALLGDINPDLIHFVGESELTPIRWENYCMLCRRPRVFTTT